MNPSIEKLWATNLKLIVGQLQVHFGKDFIITYENGFSRSAGTLLWINGKESTRKTLEDRGCARWVNVKIDHFRNEKTTLETVVTLCHPVEKNISRRLQTKYLLSKRLQNAITSFITDGRSEKLLGIIGSG